MDITEIERDLEKENDDFGIMETSVKKYEEIMRKLSDDDRGLDFKPLIKTHQVMKGHLKSIEKFLQEPKTVDSMIRGRDLINMILEVFHKLVFVATKKVGSNKSFSENGSNEKVVRLEQRLLKIFEKTQKETNRGKKEIEKYIDEFKSLSNKMKSNSFFDFRD